MFGWADGRTAVACLSERTGFDALLKALEPPAGAEIVTGAINIGAMAEIAAHHGLTVRPVDISLDTLLPDAEAVRATMTPRTALVLIAHLHGASDPLEEIAGVCRERGVPGRGRGAGLERHFSRVAARRCQPVQLRSDQDLDGAGRRRGRLPRPRADGTGGRGAGGLRADAGRVVPAPVGQVRGAQGGDSPGDLCGWSRHCASRGEIRMR